MPDPRDQEDSIQEPQDPEVDQIPGASFLLARASIEVRRENARLELSSAGLALARILTSKAIGRNEADRLHELLRQIETIAETWDPTTRILLEGDAECESHT